MNISCRQYCKLEQKKNNFCFSLHQSMNIDVSDPNSIEYALLLHVRMCMLFSVPTPISAISNFCMFTGLYSEFYSINTYLNPFYSHIFLLISNQSEQIETEIEIKNGLRSVVW